MNASTRPTAGFTLIEVVVGLAVGGIVMLIGFGALNTVQDRSEHVASSGDRAVEGAAARAAIVNWVSSAMLRSSELSIGFAGSDARELGLPADELTFPTRAETPRRAPVTGIRLFIDFDPLTRERGLVAEFTGMLGETPTPMEIAPEATNLLIRYLPVSDTDVEWTESWSAQGQLPRAVEITLLDDPAEPLPALLKMPIRIPLAIQ
jgi:prepilin-type N-terminal cleavage/methylation domain-containing protein